MRVTLARRVKTEGKWKFNTNFLKRNLCGIDHIGKLESKNIYFVVNESDVMGWINVVQNETQWLLL